MSHSEVAIAGLYDYEQETQRRAPDWGGDDLFTGTPRRRRFERGDHAAERPEPSRLRGSTRHPPPRPAALAPAPGPGVDALRMEPAPVGRRTVTVTGRPGEAALALRPRRPGRTIDERLAARPERIAAWAFGMGVLLILIAIVTAPT